MFKYETNDIDYVTFKDITTIYTAIAEIKDISHLYIKGKSIFYSTDRLKINYQEIKLNINKQETEVLADIMVRRGSDHYLYRLLYSKDIMSIIRSGFVNADTVELVQVDFNDNKKTCQLVLYQEDEDVATTIYNLKESECALIKKTINEHDYQKYTLINIPKIQILRNRRHLK